MTEPGVDYWIVDRLTGKYIGKNKKGEYYHARQKGKRMKYWGGYTLDTRLKLEPNLVAVKTY